MKLKRKIYTKNTKQKTTLKQALLRTVTAMSLIFCAVPAPVVNAAIEPVAGGVGQGSDYSFANGNVANIYPGQIVGKNALSVYRKFDLDSGKIANLHLQGADALVNVVRDRININGTVNAIKAVEANKNIIGGKLFFVSSNGMLVGSQGVINAGSLTVTTPKTNYFFPTESAERLVDASSAEDFINGAAWTDTYITGVQNMENGNITLNKSANVTILGNINTVDGVNIRAPFIYVGGKVRGADGKESGTQTATAHIKSGVTDFRDIVNIENKDGVINSGLNNNNLQLTKTNSGAIKLTAYGDIVNYRSDSNNILEINVFGNNTTKAEVVVANGSEVIGSAIDNVSITATAVNVAFDNGFLGYDVNDWTLNALFNGQAADVQAIVKIEDGAKVEGRDLSIKATAKNEFKYFDLNDPGKLVHEINDTSSFIKALTKGVEDEKSEQDPKLIEWISSFRQSVKPAFSILDSKAEVTIGQNATIKAKGSKLDISATSYVKSINDLVVKNAALEKPKPKPEPDDNPDANGHTQNIVGDYINAAVNVAQLNSTAKVTIDSNLESAGTVSINATSNVYDKNGAQVQKPEKAKADEGQVQDYSAYTNFAVCINLLNNTAEVNVNKNVTAGGDVNIRAGKPVTDDPFKSFEGSLFVDTSAKVATDDESILNIATNVVDAKSNNIVNIGGNISTTNGKVNIASDSEVGYFNAVADNKYNGDTDLEKDIVDKYYEKIIVKNASVKDAVDAIKAHTLIGEYMNLYRSKLNKAAVEANAELKGNAGSYNVTGFDIAGSMVYNNLVNDAIINIKPNSAITATKDLTINAEAKQRDSYIRVNSTISNNIKQQDGIKADDVKFMGAGAGAYNKVENKAQIIVGSGAKLTVNNISLQAKSDFDYGRPWSLTRCWLDIADTAKNLGLGEKKLFEDIGKLLPLLSDDSFEKSGERSKAIQDILTKLNSILKDYGTYKNLVNKVLGFKDNLKAYADPSSYAQLYVNSMAASSGDKTNFAFSGSVGINSITNNADIVINQGAEINARAKLSLNSQSKQIDTAIYGKTGTIFDLAKLKTDKKTLTYYVDDNTGGAYGLGGTAAVNTNNIYSTIAIGQNAVVNAGDIEIEAKNDVEDYSFAYGGTKGGELSIKGIVHYEKGRSNSVVAIDDSAVVFAGTNQEKLTTGSGALKVNADNFTNIINVIGALSRNDGALGIGASVGYLDYNVNNLALIADNGVGVTGGSVSNLGDILTANLGGLYNAANFGTATVNTAQRGSISAANIAIDAGSRGYINNLTIAGGINRDKPDAEGNNRNIVNQNNENAINKQANEARESVDELINGPNDADLEEQAIPEAAANDDAGNDEPNNGNGFFSKVVNISAVGSASVNKLRGTTATALEGTSVTINAKQAKNSVELHAEDTSYLGAYSGAIASARTNAQPSKFNGAINGAVALNEVGKNTISSLKADVKDASEVRNFAQDSSGQAAIGISIGDSPIEEAGLGVGASVSINKITNNVIANIKDADIVADKLDYKTDINNIAYDKGVQVAGGLNVEYSKTWASVGASAVANLLKNTVSAEMVNVLSGDNTNSIKEIGAINNLALSNLTQVGMGVSVGIAAGEKSKLGGMAAVTVNKVEDKVLSHVDNITAYAQSLSVQAEDGVLKQDEAVNTYVTNLKNSGIDADGSEAMCIYGKSADVDFAVNFDKEDSADFDENGNLKAEEVYKTGDFKFNNKGNTIVGMAVSVAVKTAEDGAAAGVGVSYGSFDNTFDAKLKNSEVHLYDASDKLLVGAEADSSIGNVAVGTAVKLGTGKSLALAGSGAKSAMTNNTNARVQNTDIYANNTEIKAKNDSTLVSIAGTANVNLGEGWGAGGLSYAANRLNNTTGAYMEGVTVDAFNGSSIIDVNSINDSGIYALSFAGAVGKSNYVAAEGAFAGNAGTNNTIARVDHIKLEEGQADYRNNIIYNADKIKVNADAKMTERTVAMMGSVNAFGQNNYLSLGSTVAKNIVGKADNKQQVEASLSNTNITSKITTTGSNEENADILVKAKNDNSVLALSIGGAARIGGKSLGLTATAGAAKTEIYADNIAKQVNTNIDNEEDAKDKAKKAIVKTIAKNDARIGSSADSFSVDTSKLSLAAVGAGSHVKIKSNTDALVEGGVQNVADAEVNSKSDAWMFNLATGVASSFVSGGMFAADLAANVAINDVGNSASAKIKNATINADNNINVLTDTKETIRNYGGALTLSFLGKAGVGVGVTVVSNKLDGDTVAKIEGGSVTALGHGAGKGYNRVTNQYAKEGEATGEVNSTAKTATGVLVDAEAEHKIYDISVTAGIAQGEKAGIGLDATVGLNTIEGKTEAIIEKADVNNLPQNSDKALNANSDVAVVAHDKTFLSAHTGTLAVAVSKTVSLAGAAAADNNKFDREVTAKIAGQDNTHRSTLKAQDVLVAASSESDILVTESGVGVAVTGFGGYTPAVALNANASLNKFIGRLTSEVDSVNAYVNTLKLDSERAEKVQMYDNTADVAVGKIAAGISVSVRDTDEIDVVQANLANSTITKAHYGATTNSDSSHVKLQADNNAKVKGEIGQFAANIGLGGGVGVMVDSLATHNTSAVNLNNAIIGAENNRFGDFTTLAANNFRADLTNIDGSVELGKIGVAVMTNKLHSDVYNSIKDTTVFANDISINNKDYRKLEQLAVEATVSVGAINVSVATTKGNADVSGSYSGKSYNDGKSSSEVELDEDHNQNVNYVISDVEHQVIGDKYIQNFIVNRLQQEEATAEVAADAYKYEDLEHGLIDAGANATEDASSSKDTNDANAVTKGVHIDLNHATLNSTNRLTVDNYEKSDAELKVVQAKAVVGEIAVSVNDVEFNNKLNINVDNASLLKGKNINIRSKDDTNIEMYTTDAGLVGGDISVLLGYGEHHGDNKISLNGATLIEQNNAQNTSIDIDAENNVYIKNQTVNVAVGGLHGGGINNLTKDTADVTVTMQYSNLQADNVSIKAYNTPEMKSTATAIAAMQAGAFTGTIARSEATGRADIKSLDNNTYDAKKLNLLANSGFHDTDNVDKNKYTVYSDVTGIGANGFNIGVNKAITTNKMQANIDFDKAIFATAANGKAAVDIKAINASSSRTDVYGVMVGLLAASGTNYSQMHNQSHATVNFYGGDSVTSPIIVDSLNVQAISNHRMKAKAEGHGGGVINISPYAAKIFYNKDSEDVATTSVNVKGAIQADKGISFKSQNVDNINMQADSSGNVGIFVGATGTGIDSDSVRTANTILDNASLTTVAQGGRIALEAENIVNINRLETKEKGDKDPDYDKANKDFMLQAASFTFFEDTDVGDAEIKIRDTANVEVKNNSDIASAGDLILNAHSADNVGASTYVSAASLVGAGARLNTITNITNNNNIKVDNSNLKTHSNAASVTLSAADDVKLYSVSTAEMTGSLIGGVAIATDKNTIERNNNIETRNGASIFSNRDINYYAGKLEDGSLATFDAATYAIAFNSAFIPFDTDPTVKNDFRQNNIINIANGAASNSVRNTNLYADVGFEIIKVLEGQYIGLWNSKEKKNFAVTKQEGDLNPLRTTANKVTVDGIVTAGVANNIKIDIGTEAKDCIEIVIVDQKEREAVQAYYDEYYKGDAIVKVVEKPTVKVEAHESTGLTANSLVYTREDYGNALIARYNELLSLISEYAIVDEQKKEKDTDISLGYKVEAQRIAELMVKMKLAKMEDGKLIPINTLIQQYVEIPALFASGGNVNVNSDSLIGLGSIKAQGTPVVTVNNNTPLALKINGVTMEEPGGSIIFNGHALDAEEAKRNEEINKYNKNKTANFKAIEFAPGREGTITINSNFTGIGADKEIHFIADDKGTQSSIMPMADVIVQGDILNRAGDINITSKGDSILIQGKNASDSVTINGKSVALNAARSITQGFTNGIVNVGSDPQSVYEALYQKAIKEQKDITADSIKDSIPDGQKASKASWIAGEDIFINAADINLNGIVQSGFGDYYLALDDAVEARITEVSKKYDGKHQLSDSNIMYSDDYKIVDGGAYYNAEKGYYEYRLSAYYNPSTQHIVVENVNADGGRVYLTGRISSTGSIYNQTGSGRIVCLDGVSDIIVDNHTNHEIKINTLTANNVAGMVQIADTQKGKITKITNGKVEVYNDIKDVILDDKQRTPDSTSTFAKYGSTVYDTTDGLRYNWSTGYKQGHYKRYSKDKANTLWGVGWNVIDESEQKEWSKSQKPIAEGDSTEPRKMRNGEYIGVGPTSDYNSNGFYTDYTVQQGVTKTTQEPPYDYSSGLFGIHKHRVFTWTDETINTNTYLGSVKADNDFDIKFVGHSVDEGNITIKSQGNVILNGDLGNKELVELKDSNNTVIGRNEYGTVNVTSLNGSIIQNGGNIYGEKVNLEAKNDITDIDILAGDKVYVSAISQNKGDIGLDVKANNKANADVYVASLGNKDNLAQVVTLNAEGNIRQADFYDFYRSGLVKSGEHYNITLTKDTSITDNKIGIFADRINITSANGSIYGTGANVGLNIQAGQQPITSDTLSASVNAYAHGDINLAQSNGDMRVGRIYSVAGDVTISALNGSVEDALPYMEKESLAVDDLLTVFERVGVIATENNKELIQAKTDQFRKIGEANEEYKEIFENYKYEAWDTDTLLYAVSDKLINPSTVTTSDKDPNVIGRNITVNVKQSAGNINDSYVQLDLNEMKAHKYASTNAAPEDMGLSRVEILQYLSRADQSAVQQAKDDEGNIRQYVFNIADTMPLGIQLNNNEDTGRINVITQNVVGKENDINLEGRIQNKTDAAAVLPTITHNTDINLGYMTAGNDINIASAGAIHGNQEIESSLEGKTLHLTAINGIGSYDNKVLIDIKENVSAVSDAASDAGIYLYQVSEQALRLQNISAGGNIDIVGTGNVVMYDPFVKDGVNSYLRSVKGDEIRVSSLTGSLGEGVYVNGVLQRDTNNGIRLINTETTETNKPTVVLAAANDIYALGITRGVNEGSKEPNGTLGLIIENNNKADEAGVKKELGNIGIAVNGSLALVGDNDTISSKNTLSISTAKELNVNKNYQSEDVYLKSDENIALTAGVIVADKLEIHAEQGAVVQSYDNAVGSSNPGQSLDAYRAVITTKNVDIGSRYNNFGKVDLDLLPGTTRTNANNIGNGGKRNLEITIDTPSDVLKISNDIVVHNYDDIPGDATTDNEIKVAGNVVTAGNIQVLDDEVGIVIAKDTVLDAGGAITLTSAKGGIINDGKMKSKNDIIISAQDDIKNRNALVAELGKISITSIGGQVENSASLTAGKDVSIAAGTAVNNTGDIKAGTNASISAGTTVTNSGTMTATGGNASIAAGTTVNNIGMMIAGTDASITANSDITNEGAMTATGGNASIDAGTTVNNTGVMIAGTDASITANSDITNKGAMTATNGKVDIVSANGSIINNVTAELHAGNGDVTLQSDGKLENHGNAQASSDVVLRSTNAKVNNAGNLTAEADNVSITASTSVENSGLLTAGTNASINAGTAVTNSGTMTATDGNASINAGTAVNNTGVMIAGTDASITANSDITNKGAMTATIGNANIAAGTSAFNSGAMSAGKNASITANSDITNEGAMTAINGKVDIISANGGIINKATAELQAGNGDVTLQSYSKLENYGDAQASSDVVLSSTNANVINAGNLTAEADNVSITASTSVENSGLLTAGTNASISAGTAVTNSGTMTATSGNASVEAGTTVNNTGVMTAGTNASINAKLDIDNEGAMTATNGKVDIISANGGIINKATAELQAGNGDVTLQSYSKLENYGDAQASSDVVLSSTNANVINAGNLTAEADNVSITASTSVENYGMLTATGGNASIAAGTTVNNIGMMIAGTDASIRANSDITNEGAMTATGGNASIDAGTTVNNTGVMIAGINASIRANSDITNEGAMTATGGNVSINAGTTVNNTGVMTAGTNASINAKLDIDNEGAMTATNGKVDIISAKGAIINNATAELQAGNGDVTLQSYNKLENFGDAKAHKDVVINSRFANVNNVGNLTAETHDVSITASTSVQNGGMLTATSGNASIDAGTIVNNTSVMTAGINTSINAGTAVTNSGKMTATSGNASIDAGATVNNTGAMIAGTDASISAKSDITNEGAMTATNGKVDIVSANGGIINKATAELQAGNGDVTLQSYSKLENYGDAQASSDVLISSKSANVINSGKLKAINDVTVAAGTTLNNSGEINSVVSGNVILQSRDMLTNSCDVTVRSGNIDLLAGVEPGADEQLDQTRAIINNSGNLAADGSITLKAYGSDLQGGNSAVTNTGAIRSSSTIDIQALNGSVTNMAEISGYAVDGTDEPAIPQNVIIKAKKNIYNGLNEDDVNTTVKAQQVTILAEEGSVDNYMNVVSTAGDAEITAGTSVLNKGNIIANAANTVINAGNFVENYGNMGAYGASMITAGTYITNNGSMNAGTNSTISAGNDIVNTGMMLTSNGPVSITSTNGSIYNNDNADLYAGGGNVTIRTMATGVVKASIFNRGDLAANGDIILSSANGDVYNSDDFKEYNGQALATGNVIIDAPNGRVDNTQNIYAEGIVSINAKEGLAEFAYDIFAENKNNAQTAISLSTKEAYLINRSQLIAEKGDIVLNADVEGSTGGSVINLSPGDILALGGSVNINAGAKKNETNPDKLLVVNDLTSDVSDSVTLTSGKTVNITELLSETEDYKNNMIVLTEHDYGRNTTKIYYLIDDGKEVSGDVGKKLFAEVEGIVDLFREGDVLNRGNIVALGQTTLENGVYVAQKDSEGKLVGGDINITTKYGNLTNFDNLNKVYNRTFFETEDGQKYQLAEGNIKHTANNGYYYNNIQLESGRDLYIEDLGDLIVGDEGTDRITAGGSVHVISTGGTVINAGHTDITAGESVIIEGLKGVENDGTIIAGKNIIMKSEIGVITTSGNLEAGKNAEFIGKAGVNSTSDIKAIENVLMKSEAGTITSDGELTATSGAVTIDANTGVVITGDITANSGANIYTDNNSIKLKADILVEDGLLRAWNGDSGSSNGAINIDGTLTSAKGSIDIGATSGDVIINKNATAGEMLAVGTNNGSIDASKAELIGKLVVAHTDSTDKKDRFTVGVIKASDYVSLAGNNAVVPKIVNTGTGKLITDITGPGGNSMAGDLQLTAEGDTLLRSLNVHDATVKVENGTLSIDKLHVTGTAMFDALDYITKVYGAAPAWDNSKAIYYDLGNGKTNGSCGLSIDYDKLLIGRMEDEKQKYITHIVNDLLPNYKANVGKYNDFNDGWMNLYIESINHQKSNGLLLHVDNNHYVHNQRYSAENLSSILADFKAYKTYNSYYNDTIGLFERYNLYELPDVEFVNGQLKNTLVSFVLTKDKDEKQE